MEMLRITGLDRARLASLEESPGPLMVRPTMIVRWRDSIAVLDPRGTQVVLLPPSLEGGRAFGREGEGPGELRAPVYLLPRGDSLYVYDRANRRITAFDPEGRVLKEIEVAAPVVNGSFLIQPDDQVLYPSVHPDFFLDVKKPGEQPWEAARRPPGLPLAPDRLMAQDFVLESEGKPVVVDAHNMAVLRFESLDSGSVTRPPEYLREMMMHRADSLHATSPEVMFDAILYASTTDEGILTWFLGKDDPVEALVRNDGAWIPILGAEDHEAFPRWASGLLLWNNELYVPTPEGIRVYSLEQES